MNTIFAKTEAIEQLADATFAQNIDTQVITDYNFRKTYDSIHSNIPLQRHALTEQRHPIFKLSESENKKLIGRNFAIWTSKLTAELMKLSSDIKAEEIQHMKSLITSNMPYREVIKKLTLMTLRNLLPLCQEYINDSLTGQNEVFSEKNFKNFIHEFRERVSKIRPSKKARGDTEEDRDLHIIKHVISNGILNTAEMNWSLYSIIPEVYKLQFGKHPDPETFAKIAQSVPNLILAFSSGQDQVFNVIISVLRRPVIAKDFNSPEPYCVIPIDDFPFNTLDFFITSKYALLPKYEVMHECKERVFKKFTKGEIKLAEYRRGCVGAGLITATNSWCYKVAESILFDKPREIAELYRRV